MIIRPKHSCGFGSDRQPEYTVATGRHGISAEAVSPKHARVTA
jgi:hypothetical protein